LPSQVMIGTDVSGVSPNMRFQAPKSKGFGINDRGCAVAWGSDLKDVAIWMKNGYR